MFGQAVCYAVGSKLNDPSSAGILLGLDTNDNSMFSISRLWGDSLSNEACTSLLVPQRQKSSKSYFATMTSGVALASLPRHDASIKHSLRTKMVHIPFIRPLP